MNGDCIYKTQSRPKSGFIDERRLVDATTLKIHNTDLYFTLHNRSYICFIRIMIHTFETSKTVYLTAQTLKADD